MTKVNGVLKLSTLLTALAAQLFVCAVQAEEKFSLIEANYVYKATSTEGQVAYIFGSSHRGYEKVPTALGQCVKNLLSASATVVIENNELKARQFWAGRPETVPMRRVLPLLTNEQVQALNTRLFNVQSSEADPRLLAMDMMQVDAMLSAHMSQKAQATVGLTDHGLDTEIRMAARFFNKPMGALETPEEQFAFIKAVPAELAAKNIAGQLNRLGSPRGDVLFFEMMRRLTKAYTSGDEQELLRMLPHQDGSYNDLTVVRRNPSQAQKIGDWLKGDAQKPIFFALGAGHLPSEHGVPSLLAAQGYAVTRLCGVERVDAAAASFFP